MRTAFMVLASPIPWLLVYLHLQPVEQLVQSGEQIDDRHEFQHTFIVQPKLPHRGSMNFNSVLASADG